MPEVVETNDTITNTRPSLMQPLCGDTGKGVDNKYYTYHLIDPLEEVPFYVGKGSGDRYSIHVKLVRRGKIPNGNLYLFRKIKKILDANLEPQYYFVKTEMPEASAFDLETSEIKRLRESGIKLCNLTDGGDGVTMTDEIRKKISFATRGKIVSKESRQRMSISKMGIRKGMKNPWVVGHPVSEKGKRNLSAIRTGKYKKEQNGKYIRYPEKTLLEIENLYMSLGQITLVKKQLNLMGINASWNVIKKRLIDRGIYRGKTTYFI